MFFRLTRIRFLIVVLFLSTAAAYAQGLGEAGSPPVKVPETFEHLECGIRFPFPGAIWAVTLVEDSEYRELGRGTIKLYGSELAYFDFGCIDLHDSARKLSRAELVESLNRMTKSFLEEKLEFTARPVTRLNDRETYEFDGKGDALRRVRYVIEGSRVWVFIVRSSAKHGYAEALKLLDSVEYFSIREYAEKKIATTKPKSLPQTPALRFPQSDAVIANLKGRVKSVRREALDMPAGNRERRILADDTFDEAGNLLRSFGFHDAGYPTSLTTYGFIDGARASDSVEFDVDGLEGLDEAATPSADPLLIYKYRFDDSKRLIEREQFGTGGKLNGSRTYAYKDGWIEEKSFGADDEWVSTTRRQIDDKGNEIKSELSWFHGSWREEETYDNKKFDSAGNWTERTVVKKIISGGLTHFRTSVEFRVITYHAER